jgi:hypothetical protein
MVIENYPDTYIKQNTNTAIPTNEIVEVNSSPDTSNSKIGTKVITPNMKQNEKNAIRKDLRKEGLDVDKSGKVVPKGYYYTSNGQLRKKGPKYDVELVQTSTGPEILTYGKVPSSFVQRQVERYKASQPSQQTSRDIVYTSEGVGTSKAYDLQTQTERDTTAKFTAKLINTKEGVIYYGDNNGQKDTIQRPYTTTTSSSDSQLYNSRIYSTGSSEGYVSRVDVAPKGFNFGYTEQKFTESKIGQFPLIAGGVGFVKGVGTGLYSLTFGLPGTIKGVYQTGGQLLKGENPFYSIGTQLETAPAYTLGSLAGESYSGKILDVGLTRLKNVYVASGSKYVPETKVFSSQVLQEGKKFPLATSTEQSLQRFNVATPEGKIIVSSASPSKIKGTETGMGPRAVSGLEDPGIFVTPKGEGSPAFLGISKDAGYQVSLNPLKPVKEFFRTPGVTEFEVRGVIKQPREVVSQPGFTVTKTYFETTGSKTGYAYITKRSEIGQGELVPQRFTTTSGKKVLEQGTNEIEAVVPFKAKFEYETPKTFIGRLKGYEEYTKFEGRNVPIRKAKLIGETGNDISLGKVGTVESAYKESSYALSNTKSITPASSLKYSISPTQSSITSVSSDISRVNSSSVESSSKSFSSTTSSLKSDIPKVTSTSISESEITPISSTPSKVSTPSSLSNISVSDYPTTPSITSYKPETSKYTTPNYPTTSFNTLEQPKKKKGKAKLFVKKKGVFELKGISEDQDILFKKGYDINRQTASASFKVVNESGELLRPNVLPTGFTKSKRTEGVIVQKREFRIGTAGEKFEITRKGIQAQRDKRKLI